MSCSLRLGDSAALDAVGLLGAIVSQLEVFAESAASAIGGLRPRNILVSQPVCQSISKLSSVERLHNVNLGMLS